MTPSFERRPDAGAGPPEARSTLELPAPAGTPEAPLAAALAILIFRYSWQPAVELETRRLAADGKERWRFRLRLELAPSLACEDVLLQARRALAGCGPLAAGETLEISQLSAVGPRPEDLRLSVRVEGEALRGSFLYEDAPERAGAMTRAAGHLERILSELSLRPRTPLPSTPILSPREKAAIASACDGSPRTGAPPLAHEAFEARAAAAPDAVAARHGEHSLTYGELNARANALARRLAAEGAGAETRVAVCLEPGLHVPIALLAVLKAGAAYAPLDPKHPQARLGALMDELKPRALIARADVLKTLARPGAALFAQEELDGLTGGGPAGNLGLPVGPEQTAYIYFTSGTTGTPKGAMASQRNLAAYLASARERYGIGPADVVPALARFTFSISMFELLSPLTAGGSLLLLDREDILDLERLAAALEEATLFHAGPSLLKSLAAHLKRRGAGPPAYARVRHASTGGDMIPPELLEDLKTLFPKAEVFVIYGCTEIACMGCTYPVPRDRPVRRTYVGRPFDGMSVRVLDPALGEVPAGVAGEVWFSGEGVVKGYLDRPDLTAEKFVAREGRRFYRTGDIGRLSEDGWLELLGRGDFQVKLRGIRVELGEIEHCLRRADGVRDGVVQPASIGGDEKALVAYIVMDRGGPACEGGAPIEEIRRHMARHLPDYMLPAVYVELDKLPLNLNMKVDRKALPVPSRRGGGAAPRPPRTVTEKRLAAVWLKLLGADGVGLDDRFFDAGGHSLLGLRLIVEVERELGVQLKGLELVRETFEGLAALCDERAGRQPRTSPSAAEPSEPGFSPLYFGDGEELFGVMAGAGPATRAVLICPPMGHDQLRAHYVLRRLAQRLAAAGVPSLRFDYYGCGDSLGEAAEAGCARWRRDIEQAYAELARRAPGARITAVAVRFGACLLAQAAARLDLAAIVAWDPVCDGARYFSELTAAHERFVGGWRRLFRAPPRAEDAVELLGWTCSRATAAEVKAAAFPPKPAPRAPVRRLATREAAAGQDAGWDDIDAIGFIMADVGLSRALARLALEDA